MIDFHHNIFYYYRAAKQSAQEQYDQQLEDNTTKALVNTLEHCEPNLVLQFLKWLGIEATGKVAFELQRVTIGKEKLRHKSQRLLLGIIAAPVNEEDSICNEVDKPVKGESRPDAWLHGKDFVVLIESKVGNAALEQKQMQRHFQKLQVDARQPPRCQVRTWTEIHRFFKDCLTKLQNRDKWIVEQFIQYLERQGMSEFTGFEKGMFEFFVHDEKDADIKQWIRDTMQAFGEKILSSPNGLQALKPSFYQQYHVGNFGSEDDHYWIAFGPSNFRYLAHQSMAIYEDRLDIFVNVELLAAIEKLRTKVREDKQQFIEIISKLPAPFSAQIEERKQKRVRFYDYYVIATLEAGIHKEPYGLKDAQSPGFSYIETLLKQIKYPYFSVRKHIGRKRVLKLSEGSGDNLVDEVIHIMRAFHPLVEFING